MSLVVTDRKDAPIASVISVVLALVTFLYMLPWMVAALRGKSNHLAIMLLNLLLGWTFIGWVAALIMACSAHQVVGMRPMPGYPGAQPIEQWPSQPQLPPYGQRQLPPGDF